MPAQWLRSVSFAVVVLLRLTAPAAAESGSEKSVIKTWSAPPFWSPNDETPRRGAVAAGRQRLAVGSPVPLPFIALSPCRLVDTRGNAPLTGGFLPPATVRSYTLTGVCGLPVDAQAVSLNATVVKPTGPGFLTLYPEGGAFPPVSTLNYLGGDVIVNAAVVPLSALGGISMALGVSGGDVILDTNGYYSPQGVVTGAETLHIVRGTVAAPGVIEAGTGFDHFRLSTGVYHITISFSFGGIPSVTVTPRESFNTQLTTSVRNVSAGGFDIYFTDLSGTPSDPPAFSFIAIGPP
jgi:hypothetical protein